MNTIIIVNERLIGRTADNCALGKLIRLLPRVGYLDIFEKGQFDIAVPASCLDDYNDEQLGQHARDFYHQHREFVILSNFRETKNLYGHFRPKEDIFSS